jgi:type IV secretion system protein VirD4
VASDGGLAAEGSRQRRATVSWNPFDRVRRHSPYQFRDVANIIEQIADPKGKGLTDHWQPSAANFMLGVALHLVETTSNCSLTAVLGAIDSGATLTVLFNTLAGSPNPQVAQVGNGMLATADRERASIVSTARRLLRLYRDPVVARNTARSSFRIEDLMDAAQPVTLYIETRGEDELRLRPLVRLLLSLCFGQIISQDEHEHGMLLVIDEVATLGEMEPLELMLSKIAGSRVNALLACQDYEQILKTYGPHEGLSAHCDVVVAHAPRNTKTAEWLSDRTGESTFVVEEVSEGRDAQNRRTANRMYRSMARPVLTPDEVSRLKLPARDAQGRITAPGELLVLQGGQHVVIGTQSLAFRDPELSRRMAIPAPNTDTVIPRSPHVSVVTVGPLRTALS